MTVYDKQHLSIWVHTKFYNKEKQVERIKKTIVIEQKGCTCQICEDIRLQCRYMYARICKYSRVGLSRTSRDKLLWFDLDQIRLKLSLDFCDRVSRESEIGSTQVKVGLILVQFKPTIQCIVH